jgi:hypothetical protein
MEFSVGALAVHRRKGGDRMSDRRGSLRWEPGIHRMEDDDGAAEPKEDLGALACGQSRLGHHARKKEALCRKRRWWTRLS